MNNILMLNPDSMPVKLMEIKDPPSELYFRGKAKLLDDKPAVAVVGSRKITSYAKTVTETIVQDLARAGVVIVSGLAMGVDALAHKTALAAGGKTIAVLPTSLDKIYPRENFRIGEKIAQEGLLLSEYPSGMPPQKYFFAERNRIVSGLSDAVLVIQASERSGTLITARIAKEQGKLLFVVPGEITSSAFAGNHRLIREGATLASSANDILLEIGGELSQRQTTLIEDPILRLISEGFTQTSQLISELKLSVQDFNKRICLLEISGDVVKTATGWRVPGN